MKVLCFSPNDAVWLWTLPQAQFLEALKQRGDEILYVHCERTLTKFCMSMAASGVAFSDGPEKKAAVCERCCSQSRLVRAKFGFAGNPIRAYTTDEDVIQADALSSRERVGDLIAHEMDGVPVGRIALYEAIIQTKHTEMQLHGDAETLYRMTFRNAVIVAAATRRMLQQFKPDICVSYHTAYAYNRTFLQVAGRAGVPVFSLNGSLNMGELDTHLVAAKADPEGMFKQLIQAWDRYREVVCTRDEFQAVAEHLLALMNGAGFAYSVAMRKGGGLPPHLAVPPGKKLVLVLLSSYDELLASELAAFGWSTHNEVFASQIEWVAWILDFAALRDDLHVVIRVHPREFPVRGRGARSRHVAQLEEVFARRPRNVSINLPTDGVPLYELLVEADAALVAWSSAGMEAGMLGVPVVTYFGDALLCPRGLFFDARTRTQYKAMVEAALQAEWSFARARGFFRWAVLMLVRTRISVARSGRVKPGSSALVTFFKRSAGFLRRKLLRISHEEWAIMTRPRPLREMDKIHALIDGRLNAFYELPSATGQPGSEESETDALREQLGRIAAQFEHLCGRAPAKLAAMVRQARGPASSA